MRTVAVIIEIVLLSAIIYSLLTALKLTALDLGVGKRYSRAITMGIALGGVIAVVFFIVHLAMFYPE